MAVYIERYVSALQSAGNHTGSEVDPWTFDEAVTKAAAGDRINVKADGTYTLNSGSQDYTWVSGVQYGTLLYPVQWRGYDTDVTDGGRATLRTSGNTKRLVLGAPSDTYKRRTWSALNFDYESDSNVNASGSLVLSNNSPGPIFINCRISNSHTGDSQWSVAVTGDFGATFLGCLLEVCNTTASYPIYNTHGNTFIGCTMKGPRQLALGIGSGCGVFYRNVCICTGANPNSFSVFSSTSHSGGTVGSTLLYSNNVFVNYGAGVNLLSDNSHTPNGAWLNNIFVNASFGFVVSDPAYNSRSDLLLLGNKFWNVTTPYSGPGFLDTFLDPSLGVEMLASDPFTDSANGDFSLVLGSAAVNAAIPLSDYAGTLFSLDCGALEFQALVCDYPDQDDVLNGVSFDYGNQAGAAVMPAAGVVKKDEPFDAPSRNKVGTYTRNLSFEDSSHAVT